MQLMTPLAWYGGKSRLVPHILPLLPPHQRYIEVCAGGLALLIAKKPSRIEIANDKNKMVYTFWRVLRDPETGERLRQALQYTEYGREQYAACKDSWKDESLPDVERVRRWFVFLQQSFTREETRDSGWRKPYGYQSEHRAEVNIWVNKVDRLQAVAHRLRRVALENRDCLDLLRDYDAPDTLFYLDPPYLPESRSETGNYEEEMSYEQHEALLELANRSQGQIIISGYSSPLYDEALRDWQRYEVTRRGEIHNNLQEPTDRTEVIWLKRHTLPTLFTFDLESSR